MGLCMWKVIPKSSGVPGAEERGRRGENTKQYAGRQVAPVGETWDQLLPRKCQWKTSGWFHQAESKLGCSGTKLSVSLTMRCPENC